MNTQAEKPTGWPEPKRLGEDLYTASSCGDRRTDIERQEGEGMAKTLNQLGGAFPKRDPLASVTEQDVGPQIATAPGLSDSWPVPEPLPDRFPDVAQFDLELMPEVKEKTALSRSSIYAKSKARAFPQPIHPSGSRCACWIESEIDAWIDQQIATSRDGK